MTMDIAETTAPKSDQQNFDDYAAGPKTVTVSEVRKGSEEQPVEIHLAEYPGRPFKPSKTVRRVLVAAWGRDAAAYVGRRMTLFGDPTVRFGGAAVGGIRVSHLSHLEKKLTVAVTVTKGKRAPYIVEPLVEQPVVDYDAIEEHVSATDSDDELRRVYEEMKTDGSDRAVQVLELVKARKAALDTARATS